MRQDITSRSYLSKILIIVALFVFLPMAFSSLATDTTSSYIASSVCFFIITIIGVKLILSENKYVKFYSIAFIVQLLIGIVHYLYFVDSNYFSTNGEGSVRFYHEYLSVYDAIDGLQDARRNYGLLYVMDAKEFLITHAEIWHIISYPFFFLQHKWLNYAPLNIFSSLITSCNILLLYKLNYEVKKPVERAIMIWTAFFPSFLLNDILWRDAFGICIISIGLVLTAISTSTIAKILSAIVFATGAFIQRTMYVVLAGISFFWGSITKFPSGFLKLFYAVIGLVAIYYLSEFADSANGEGYNDIYINSVSFLALPIKIVFGMIGPFPWFLFSDLVETNPAFAWQLQDYLMGTFQFGYLLALFFQWKRFSFRNLNALTVMGFGIMLSGFVSSHLHIVYISEGVIFTLPWFFSCIELDYRRYIKYSLITLITLNVLVFVMDNFGIGNIWR